MSKKVLIVDDDPGLQDALRLIFVRAGYDTTVLASPETILDRSAETPDIYILDKQLSGVDGLDVCRFLKSADATKDIPVIMLSATPHVRKLAKAACANDFLEKPFRQRELLAIVARQLALVARAAQATT